MSHQYPINICSEGDIPQWDNLIPILESLFPVKFSASRQRGVEEAGELLIDRVENCVQGRDNGQHISSLRVPRRAVQSFKNDLLDIAVQFADHPAVPLPFRGRSLRAKIAGEPKLLSLSGNEQALASTEHGPVWSLNTEHGVSHFTSGFAIPAITSHNDLKDVLNEERFFEMIPLLHWLREICADTAFEGPPSGACFIFDDPNLHWKRYGFVDFQQIVTHAARENYHVSFATIPLDSWFTHQATAEIFKRNSRRISLAIHGNNHTRCELAQPYTPWQRASLLRQAIHRIERFEHRSGLDVSRVMVPPHGACSEEMLAELPQFGFESACISHGSLRAHNRTKTWTKAVGGLPSEVVHGCPVMPRWGFAGNSTNAVLLAAFLKQRLILRGHHQDLKNGIELLDQHARLINSLGVSWANLGDLSRTNFCWRLEGTTFTVKALGNKLTVQLPEGATNLIIESPREDSRSAWKISGLNGNPLVTRTGEIASLPRRRNAEISIESLPARPVLVDRVRGGLAGRAVVRRVLSEARDRLLPLGANRYR